MKKILKAVGDLKKTLITTESKNALNKLCKEIKAYAVESDRYDEPDADYPNTIDAGIGTIHWESNNLQLQAIMEAIDEKLVKVSPNAITAAIEAIP